MRITKNPAISGKVAVAEPDDIKRSSLGIQATELPARRRRASVI